MRPEVKKLAWLWTDSAEALDKYLKEKLAESQRITKCDDWCVKRGRLCSYHEGMDDMIGWVERFCEEQP